MNDFPIHFTVNDIWPGFDGARDKFDVNSGDKTFPDIKEPDFWAVYERCKPYTLLSTDRFYNLYTAVRYIAENNISGDFVECGVLFGGASVGTAIFCNRFGIGDRKHFLCDTFCGFPHPVVETDFAGRKVSIGASANFRAIVERQIEMSGIDPSRFVLVEGDIARTLPHEAMKQLCLLRLDTDDHDSTLHELRALYPALADGGVLIIDDYGHFEGARRAVDSYFSSLRRRPYLQRVDYGGRCAVK